MVGLLAAPASAADAPGVTITLPPQTEIDKLIDLTAQFVGVSIQYNPQKISGVVRLSVRGQLSKAELWSVFNQVLVSQGFTTVIAGLPPVYQVVPMAEASGLSVALAPEDAAKLPHQPGYQVMILELVHLGSEAAVKVLSTMLTGQVGQVRTLGQENRKLVVAGPRSLIAQVRAVLAVVDRPGMVPGVRLYRPKRASPQALQTAGAAAWAALARIGGGERLAEIQLSPDGSQMVLLASADDIDRLGDLLENLDNAEPMETRSYRPRYFGIGEVAALIQQLTRPERGSPTVDIVRDKLTSSLIIKATAEQHRRIEGVLKGLDDAPPTARRQVRSFIVRHRQADELAKVLAGLISTGVVQNGGNSDAKGDGTGAPPPSESLSAVPGVAPAPASNGTGGVNGSLSGQMSAMATPRPGADPVVVSGGGDNPVVLASDVVTNSLIAIGDPKALDQVASLLVHLDQRQPQVDIEVIMVSVSASQNRSLGFELIALIENGAMSGTVSQLFGLGQGTGLARVPLATATGLSGSVLNPGDFAGVVQALETITDGKQIIRARIVVSNNEKATVNGVVQEPLVATNASTTVATTSVSGTTDAGTEIAITPQISTADYVTLTYGISQSSFLGKSVISNGSVIPPTKRSDSVTSVATIPDGHVIALGGLSNRGQDLNESRVPLLGGVPFLGELFKSKSTGTSESRFFVFIRATVLRNTQFQDLRRTSVGVAAEAELPADQPRLEPQLIR